MSNEINGPNAFDKDHIPGECNILKCKKIARAFTGNTGYFICDYHTVEDTIKQHKEERAKQCQTK